MKTWMLSLIAALLLCSPGFAQTTPASSVGYTDTQLGAYDNIDLSSLYLGLQIPIQSKSGSSKLPFSYSIVGFPNVMPGVWGQTSVNLGVPYFPFGGIQFGSGPVICGTGSNQIYVASYGGFGFVDAKGVFHSFGNPLTGGNTQLACQNTTQNFRTADGALSLTAAVNSSYQMFYTVSDSFGNVLVNNARGGGFVATGWVANTNFGLSAMLYDSHGNVQITTACASNVCTSNNGAAPTFNATVGGTTTDGSLTWTNLGLPSASIKDTNGNKISVTITNLTGATQSGGGSYADASRDYTKTQVWTYTDVMATTPLTVTYPALQTATGGLNATAQVAMAYTDASGTARNVYVNESYMAITPPNAPTGLPLLNGPTLLGVNSTIDGAGIIHGNSFNNASPFPYYPTSVVYPDGSTIGLAYETVPGASGSGTATITSVGVANNLATVDFTGLNTLTKASQITGITVSGTKPNLTIKFTVSGTNPWAAGNAFTLRYMSPANLGLDGTSYTVSSVTTNTVTVQGNSLYPITATETQGWLVAGVGKLNFSGLTTALFLNNVTPTNVQYGMLPNPLGSAQASTSSVAWYYYSNLASYGYFPKAGDVVDIGGYANAEFNGTNKTIATVVTQSSFGPYFTVNGTYTQGDVSNYGAVLPVNLAGSNYIQFQFPHANYTQATDTGSISNGGSATTTTGRLAQITLPTGGTIKYVYSGGENGSGINTDGSYATIKRTTLDGATTFTHTPGSSGANVQFPTGAFGQSFVVNTLLGLQVATGQVGSFGDYYLYSVTQANITNLVISGTTNNYTGVATFTGGSTWIAANQIVFVDAPGAPIPNYASVTITGVTSNTFSFSCICTGTFNGAVTGFATSAAPYGSSSHMYGVITSLLPNSTISYANGAASSASSTTVVDPSGNETVYSFAGLRQVDQKVFQGTPANVLLNPGFESGLTNWFSNGGTTPYSDTVQCPTQLGITGSCPAGTVTYTDEGSNLDQWDVNAANGLLDIPLGVSSPGFCCQGGFPPPPVTTTQTATIIGVSISGSTVTAQISGTLPSNYAIGNPAVISFSGSGLSALNGTFPITATCPGCSPQTFSWTQSGSYSCSTTAENIQWITGTASNDGTLFTVAATVANTFSVGMPVGITGTTFSFLNNNFYTVSATTSSTFSFDAPGVHDTVFQLPTPGTATQTPCHLWSNGSASVTVTVSAPPNVASVQVVQINGQWSLVVALNTPLPKGNRIGVGGTPITFSGMTHATWLNGLSLTPTTWDGQNVFGFAVPSGAPEPYGPTAETTAFAACVQSSSSTVYTSDWVYITNINLPNVPAGSTITGFTFNAIDTQATTTSAVTVTLQLVSNGVLVGTPKTTCTANGQACTYGGPTDTWGTSGLIWGPGVGVAIKATITNPANGNAQTLGYCCYNGSGYSVSVNSTTTSQWAQSTSQFQSGTASAWISSASYAVLTSLNSSGTSYLPINPNDQIQYSAAMLRTTGTGGMGWTCAFYDASKTFISSCPEIGPIVQLSTPPPGGGTIVGPFAPSTWTNYSNIVIAPSNAAFIAMFAEVHGQGDTDTSATTMYIDNASMVDLTSSGLLQEVVTCYNEPFLGGSGNNTAPCTNPALLLSTSTPITEVDSYTFVPGVGTPYAGGGASAITQSFDAYGRLTSTAMYDYGRTTYTKKGTRTYGTYTGTFTTSASTSNCSPLANTAITAPVCMTVSTDSSGNVLDESAFKYDTNGNLTGANVIDVPDTKNSVWNYTYSSKGALATSSDPNGNLVTYTSTNCNSLLPTTVADKLLSVSMTYDCNSAQPKTFTAPDGGVWTSVYTDPLSRVTSQTTPLTTTSFTDTMTYSYTPTSASQTRTFNSGNTVAESLATFDGLGRLLLDQKSYSSTQFTTVQNTYNPVGLLHYISNPFLSAAGVTGTGLTEAATITYDGMGRPLNLVNVNGGTRNFQYIGRDILVTQGSNIGQVEVNGLGQIVSYCQINSLTGSGACGQDNAKTGFLTTYTYNARGQVAQISQNAQPSSAAPQLKTSTYDGFGRQLTDTRPENSLTYTWDTDPAGTCPASAGDVVRVQDSNGNVICNSYDFEHRVLTRTYPSGPNSASTPAKYFVYDTSATFTCPTGANQKGRLAEMYTGSPSSKTTDEGFCYSTRGDLTDMFETTPHSGGYFHTTATYWEDGSIKALSGVPGITGSFTYTPNYAWTNTVSGPSSASLVKSVTSLFGDRPSVITYGSNDTDTFNQDSKQNFSGFSSTVGSKTVSNAWTWNNNGFPTTQVITNPFDTVAAGLTCSYTWDSLIRPNTLRCTNTATAADVWGQNYAYDEFGNMKKTIPAGFAGQTWSPTYNLAKNQYTGSTFAYDSNGQVTNDTINTYTWGSDGKMLSVTNIATGVVTSYTYGADGSLVEESTSGVTGHTQYVLSPLGKIATTTSTN